MVRRRRRRRHRCAVCWIGDRRFWAVQSCSSAANLRANTCDDDDEEILLVLLVIEAPSNDGVIVETIYLGRDKKKQQGNAATPAFSLGKPPVYCVVVWIVACGGFSFCSSSSLPPTIKCCLAMNDKSQFCGSAGVARRGWKLESAAAPSPHRSILFSSLG